MLDSVTQSKPNGLMTLFFGVQMLRSGASFFGVFAKSVEKRFIGFTALRANSTIKSDFSSKFTWVDTFISRIPGIAICGNWILRKSNDRVPCLSVR